MRMTNLKLWLVVTALALGFATTTVVRGDEGHEALEKAMETINDGYKGLRKAARSKAFDPASAKIVNAMAQAAVAAMAEVPPMAKEVPTAERPKFIAEYQASMKELAIQLMDLQIAIATSNNDKALELVDALATAKKTGHEKFTKE